MTAAPFHVWEGIFASFSEAPASGPGFEGETWRQRSMIAARQSMEQLRAGQVLDYSMRQRNAVLVTLTAALLARQSRVRILDFGGGPGYGFMVLLSAIPDAAKKIDYHIVEVENVCREAPALFDAAAAPKFQTDLPAKLAYDIVFTASTLQYIEDWRGICRALAAYRAPYLLFSDVFAYAGAAYVTLQNYYDSRIRHWILNEGEFIAEIAGGNYALDLKSDCSVKILDEYGPLPMTNLPIGKRVTNARHFMFSC